jgi:diguanylate cyclase (GGDEF)-like protein
MAATSLSQKDSPLGAFCRRPSGRMDKLRAITRDEDVCRRSWIALMFLYLDPFRRVNDTCDHDGDSVVTALVRGLMRHACDDDALIRNGGDEFLYPLINLPGRKPVAPIPRRAREATESSLHAGSPQLAIAPNICIVLYPDHGTGGQAPIADAEAPMHRAERLRSHCELFEPPTASCLASQRRADRIA